MTLILILIVVLYALFSITTALGIRVAVSDENNTPLPTVSVIIVARDEEKWLPSCLESLTKLDYPVSKHEFILINDRSVDRTRDILNRFVESQSNSKILHIKKVPPSFTGKINGLIEGIKRSSGEILLFTDADCIVPSTWIRTMIQGLDKDTGMVGGFIQLDREDKPSSLFARLQSIDWIYLTAIGSSWANWGKPLSIFGNNFLIRRKDYNEIGGFQSISGHILEDFALLRNYRKRSESSVRIPLDHRCLIITRAAKNISEFINQRKRWSIGARSHSLFAIVLMVTTFLAHLVTLLAFLTGWISSALIAFTILLLCDFIVLIRPLKILRRLDLIRFIPLYELFFFTYSLFVAPIFLFGRKVTWKKSRLNRHVTTSS